MFAKKTPLNFSKWSKYCSLVQNCQNVVKPLKDQFAKKGKTKAPTTTLSTILASSHHHNFWSIVLTSKCLEVLIHKLCNFCNTILTSKLCVWRSRFKVMYLLLPWEYSYKWNSCSKEICTKDCFVEIILTSVHDTKQCACHNNCKSFSELYWWSNMKTTWLLLLSILFDQEIYVEMVNG